MGALLKRPNERFEFGSRITQKPVRGLKFRWSRPYLRQCLVGRLSKRLGKRYGSPDHPWIAELSPTHHRTDSRFRRFAEVHTLQDRCEAAQVNDEFASDRNRLRTSDQRSDEYEYEYD
jgi:hypothetical protein